MKKRSGTSGARSGRVSEPVQVYLAGPDLDLLDRLSTRLGATKSDVLRRGLSALDAQSAAARRADVGPPIPVFTGGTGPRAGVTFDRMAALLDIMDEADDPR
ncbi:MAG: hypothetical protein IPJ78_00935 [Gemmatimonadetes bacterium]|nr:hypothetical protein [Gemmatimonadota bacterium]MCC7002045.1 hypothetical protein [Gemmatimonadaceae bacterium]